MGMSPLEQNMQSAGLAGVDRLAANAMFPQSQMDKTQYATPSQMPTSADVMRADYDTKTDPYTGLAAPMKKGGLAAIRFAEGGDVPSWDPTSGQVLLQKIDPNNIDPDTGQPVIKTVNYTIPKDDIKTFVPNDESAGGQYILKDGSTMWVGGDGTVQSATPARNEYTLNDQGYYQPTGPGLTWDGNTSTLTKKIGGVDVQVPGMFTKGGYKDQSGGLRTDANGVPVALPPAQYDSGAGKSGLDDVGKYGTIAAMAAMVGPAAYEAMGLGAAELMGPTYAELGYTPVAAAEGVGGAAAGEAAANSMSLKDAYNAYKYANLAKNVLGMATGAGSQSGYGLNAAPNADKYAAFNPGITSPIGLSSTAGYDKTPWANLEPSITLSKLSDFASKDSKNMAAGGMTGIGHLGGYSDGGRLLKGPGDGMSDNIPASIGHKQPARLADGEFVVPADVVSHLGNGSTDAGAKQLYAMMDRVRKARTGNKKQGKQINPNKFLPKG